MTLDLPDEYLPLLVRALEQYHAYTVATQREDRRYLQAAELIKAGERKPPQREGSAKKVSRRRA